MKHWLFKTEPDEFSIEDLQKKGSAGARWDGIRNYQARNLLRDEVAEGDTVWIYHSRCKHLGLVGLANVLSAAYPDPAQWDPESPYFDPKSSLDAPRWYCVDVAHRETFSTLIPLAKIKRDPRLQEMVLLKQGRLSIQPITEAEAKVLLKWTQGNA